MAVWSEIPANDVISRNWRIDAEYYRPDLLAYENAVKCFPNGWCNLEDMCSIVTDGDHMKRDYKEEGVLFLTSENFIEHHINYESNLFISPKYEATLARARSEHECVFLTKTGRWYGKAAVCLQETPVFNISADVAKMRVRNGYDPYFLACYLNSEIGYELIRRESTGATRDRIILDNLRIVPVPIITKSNEFKNYVNAIAEKYTQTKSFYAEAEALLLSALRLDPLDLRHQLTYEANFKDLEAAVRYDAEHFQPKLRRTIEHMRSLNSGSVVPLGNIVPDVRRGTQPEYIEDGEVVVVNSQHLGATLVNIDDTERTNETHWNSSLRSQLKQFDVLLYATGAYIGRTNVWLEDVPAVASNHVTIIRPLSGINPIYLAVYLNSPVGLIQSDQWACGSAQREIYPSAINKFAIYIAPNELQEEIATKVKQSYKARAEAKALLEQAKQRVEEMILQGE